MDIDILETASLNESEAASSRTRQLNASVAITVALLATFMGICKVKDDNIVQNMQQSQANKIDHWSFYQARNIREDVAKAALLQLQVAAPTTAADAKYESYQKAITQYEALVKDQESKKGELLAQAQQDQRDYDAANFHDDQFDLADAMLAIAISLLAVTALTGQWWLYFLALLPTVFGVVMGLSGLLGWSVHPDWLIRLLS